MKPEEFVELVARLTTSREAEQDGDGRCEADSTLDSLIGVARDLTAQTFAQSSGLKAVHLFDELGTQILCLKKDAGVLVRYRGREVQVADISIREDAVVLDITDEAVKEKPA